MVQSKIKIKKICRDTKKKIAEQGYERDWQQCRSKLKNLKPDNRKVKDNNGETGRGRKTCSELDSILGHRPASVPTTLLDTGNSTTGSSTDPQHSEPEEKEDNLNGKEINHY